LQKFSQEQLKDLEHIIKENEEQIKNSANSLSKLLEITGSVANKLDEIEDLIHQLAKLGRSETDQIKERIAELENNLLAEIEKLGVSEFDYTIPSERLLFYLKLDYFLRNAHSIFLEQNKIAHTLYRDILKKGHQATTEKKGLDYPLYELHKNNLMDRDDLKIFSYIRGVTNDIERFNWYAKELLMKNNKFVSKSDLLAKLKIHYSTWHAKYQIYKDDPNMCLIYVGPDQNAGFPKGIDGYIDDMISQLKREIKLDH